MHLLIPADTWKTCSFFCEENSKVSWCGDTEATPSLCLRVLSVFLLSRPSHLVSLHATCVNAFLNRNSFQMRAEERKAIPILFWHGSTVRNTTAFAFRRLVLRHCNPQPPKSCKFCSVWDNKFSSFPTWGHTKTTQKSMGSKLGMTQVKVMGQMSHKTCFCVRVTANLSFLLFRQVRTTGPQGNRLATRLPSAWLQPSSS